MTVYISQGLHCHSEQLPNIQLPKPQPLQRGCVHQVSSSAIY
ncbi:rCG50774 [Rattus norvegicus]|uniref:RCG50774 n=1 Tax=Rattus norvegicus TaxID=10116 RepID=A6KC15_RAT|nr:rCG50774 [Rattus norvegicus]